MTTKEEEEAARQARLPPQEAATVAMAPSLEPRQLQRRPRQPTVRSTSMYPSTLAARLHSCSRSRATTILSVSWCCIWQSSSVYCAAPPHTLPLSLSTLCLSCCLLSTISAELQEFGVISTPSDGAVRYFYGLPLSYRARAHMREVLEGGAKACNTWDASRMHSVHKRQRERHAVRQVTHLRRTASDSALPQLPATLNTAEAAYLVLHELQRRLCAVQALAAARTGAAGDDVRLVVVEEEETSEGGAAHAVVTSPNATYVRRKCALA